MQKSQLVFHRNPTPDNSNLPKWKATNNFPLKYYRIGNYKFPGERMVGMESGGIFADRADFWRKIGAHLPARNSAKEEL